MGFVSNEEAAQNNQKNVGYTIQIAAPQETQQQQEQQRYAQQFMNQQMFINQHNGQVRNIFAEARQKEAYMVLDYMREIRSALDTSSLTVGEGDGGATARPPLVPAFDEINRGKLQEAYLRLVERAVNHTEHFMKIEMNMKLTNEIKKADEQTIS